MRARLRSEACYLEAVDFDCECINANCAGKKFKARMQEDGFGGSEKCEGLEVGRCLLEDRFVRWMIRRTNVTRRES
jgi:hypothetical protein